VRRETGDVKPRTRASHHREPIRQATGIRSQASGKSETKTFAPQRGTDEVSVWGGRHKQVRATEGIWVVDTKKKLNHLSAD